MTWLRGRKLKWLFLTMLLLVPVAVWTFYKPVRAIVPQLVGLTCIRETICLDDVNRSTAAAMLYDEALQFVDTKVGRIEQPPRVIFCSTDPCYHIFGLDKPTAHTTPFGIFVSPHGWAPHYIRHEMIHHLQSEHLGFWKVGPVARWRSPDWLLEGMAYALSEDPRPVLAEPYQTYRSSFKVWYVSMDKKQLWEAAQEP